MEHILLIGHGSPRKEANCNDTVGSLLHRMLHPGCDGQCVKVAYLQFEHPGVMDAITGCVEGGATRIVIHPYFLNAGMHVTKDIPEMIKEAEGRYPWVEFLYTEPLGIHEKLVQVAAERIRAARGGNPRDIEARSFEIISEEVDLSDVPEEQVPIVQRVIHATGDFEFKRTLRFHPEAVRTGIKAIRAGRDILTDVEMVRAGINRGLLERWGGQVVCHLRQVKTSRTGTRAERGLEAALGGNPRIGIVAVGNAPTALMKAVEMLNAEPREGVLVVGVPVGFVNAVESKALLAGQSFPFITALGRKGGSPVAAAIVNALLKMAGAES